MTRTYRRRSCIKKNSINNHPVVKCFDLFGNYIKKRPDYRLSYWETYSGIKKSNQRKSLLRDFRSTF